MCPLCLALFNWHSVFKHHPCCSTCWYPIPFSGWIFIRCTGTLCFIYPLTSWWTSELFLLFSCYEKCCCEHSCTSYGWNASLFLDMYLGVELLNLMVAPLLILRNCQTGSQSSCTCFTFQLALHEGSDFSTSSPRLVTICLFVVTIPGDVKCRCVVVLTCISLVTYDIEHLFVMCLVAIHIYVSWGRGKCLFISFAIFFNYLSFYYWVIRVLYICWIQVPYRG